MENKAVWIQDSGRDAIVAPAAVPEPGEGELLIRTKAVAVQPGEWKIRDGIIPIKLTYPTVIGLSLSGIVEKVGPGVTRFRSGDRVASNSTGVLRDDSRFGAYQRFTLVPQALTSKIGDTPFDEAASLITGYGVISALFLHLGLDRPDGIHASSTKGEKLLIWGVSSSFGAIAAQIAAIAGYTVVGVAAGRHQQLAETIGVSHFADRTSESIVRTLISLGPFKATLAAADDADDQLKIGAVLQAQGGGRFLSTMGVRPGVTLPDGVTGFFKQYLDDYVNPENAEFTNWAWWALFEQLFANKQLKSVPLEVVGGLSKVAEAWNSLKEHKVSGKRLIVLPDID